MNWFTNEIIANKSAIDKQRLFDQDGGCEHVEADVNLAYSLGCENDSFGIVSSYVSCKACHEAALQEEKEKEHFCDDCKNKVKRKDGFFWRWYDFYAPQGDEPYFICNACAILPKHLERNAQDRADYNAEMGFNEEEPGYS